MRLTRIFYAHFLDSTWFISVRLWDIEKQTNAAVYKGHNYPVWDVDTRYGQNKKYAWGNEILCCKKKLSLLIGYLVNLFYVESIFVIFKSHFIGFVKEKKII